MKTRREFLRSTSLIALAPMVPTFLNNLARAAEARADSRILVVVQLQGGNDGINTVVPFDDPAYATQRPSLRIKPDEVLKITPHLGFNPGMRAMADLLESGRLAIVQGVGYPNPNRSHFESMRIWQTARLNPKFGELGWIGSAFDAAKKRSAGAGPDALYVGEEELPVALSGRHAETAAISEPSELELRLTSPDMQNDPSGQDATAFAHRSVLRAYGTARELSRTPATQPSKTTYPSTQLGKHLGIVSQIIKSGAATRVYYVSQGNYDTHVAQLPQHDSLLRELSSAMKTFLDDLHDAGLAERVMLMTFSEFGRRVAENGSFGTDHGAAAPVFIAGQCVRPGLVGEAPNLSDLRAGDVKASIDFRRVYATLLRDWLQISPSDALSSFQSLPLIRA
jgi:uncharacterized protein (DUF1501 family)